MNNNPKISLGNPVAPSCGEGGFVAVFASKTNSFDFSTPKLVDFSG